jgi:hypothetical protein
MKVEVIDFDKLPSLLGITDHMELKNLLENCDVDSKDGFGESRMERLLNTNQFKNPFTKNEKSIQS